jgi:hypothetical protein
MDKQKLSKLVLTSNVSVSTIPSTASRNEREKIIREFVTSVNRMQDGEVVLIVANS